MITEDEFRQWKKEEVTLQFFKRLREQLEVLKENLIFNNVSSEDEGVVKGKGICLAEILNITYDDVTNQ